MRPLADRYRFLTEVSLPPHRSPKGAGGRERLALGVAGLRLKSLGEPMNLVIWLPALFVLGSVSMLACIAFAEACARI
jgi:hypothetical protein